VPVDLASLCEETAGLVRAQRRYAGIEIEVQREGDPPRAMADPNGVTQIVLNLLLNAADAVIQDADTPRISISVAPAVAALRSGEVAVQALARRRPDAVECRIEDNGPGIAWEDRERIFDPFFSTKAPGEGTGLGLSNASRMAEDLGGSLALAPDSPSIGATFVLCLPAASEAETPGAVRAEA
jgi:two-component system NtrC family sensor kinase